MLSKLFWTLSATLALLVGSQLPLVTHFTSPATALAASAKQTATVSTEELTQFASAFRAVQEIDQASRQEIVALVQQAGFEPQRFGAIAESLQNQTELTPPLAEGEEERFFAVAQQIQQMQERIQTQMVEAVEAEGLEPQRFQEIFAAVRDDETLQNRVEQLLQN